MLTLTKKITGDLMEATEFNSSPRYSLVGTVYEDSTINTSNFLIILQNFSKTVQLTELTTPSNLGMTSNNNKRFTEIEL